jgi:hypothetical protein
MTRTETGDGSLDSGPPTPAEASRAAKVAFIGTTIEW